VPSAEAGANPPGIGAPRLRVRGQATAVGAALDLARSGRSHALLLVGPGGVGKTTLALDVAAVLLCSAAAAERPCRACRGCRMVGSGNHPDLHRLAPEGPGGQIRIGARGDAEAGTVRRLIADLAMLPVEGGARVAVIEHAERLNEDAQSALLKTLEEPPAGVMLLLCADEEERLLPTVRSRCARVRLGPLGSRAIEALLEELAGVDAPTAGRLGRLSGGRPGVALAWAAAPAAVVARAEIGRTLLDLLTARRAARLVAVRGLLAAAAEALSALDGDDRAPVRPARSVPRGKEPAALGDSGNPAAAEADTAAPRRAPAAERRRAATLLVDIWRSVARDLALAQAGDLRSVHDPALIDDLTAAAEHVAPGAAGRFLARLDRAGELLESNVSPELIADDLVLSWPGLAA